MLDPAKDSHVLASIITSQGPELSEFWARHARWESGIISSKGAGPGQLERLKQLSVLIDYLRQRLDESVEQAFVSSFNVKKAVAAAGSGRSCGHARSRGAVRRLAEGRFADTSATEYFSAMTQHINAIFALQGEVSAALKDLLNERVARYEQRMVVALAWATLGCRSFYLPLSSSYGILPAH